jgi:hypothetical protein
LQLAQSQIKFNITKKSKTQFNYPSDLHIYRQKLEPIPLLSWDLPLINIEIGTPPQVFEVLLETASLESWVPLQRTHSQNPNFKQFFNNEISRSYKNLTEKKVIFHRDGYINATHGTESIDVQGTALSNFHMFFAEQAVFIRDIEYNGILAMGNYNTNSTYAKQFSLLENLLQQKKIDRRIFAIEYFTNYKDKNTNSRNKNNSALNINDNINDDYIKGVLTIGSYPDEVKEYLSGLKNSKIGAPRPWNFLDNFTYEGSPTNMHSDDLDIYRTYNRLNSHNKNTSIYAECDIINFHNIYNSKTSLNSLNKKTHTNAFSILNRSENPNNNLWSCKLGYIYFPHSNSRVSKMRDIPQKTAIFDSGINGIYIPYSIFEKYFLKIYLKDLLEKRYCKMSRYLINCQKDLDISNLSPIYLNFGNFTAKLNPSELFRDISESGFEYKIFQVMVSMLDEDLFLIGTPMLNKFITVFDWDRQRMGFYGEDVSLGEPIRESKLSVFDFFMILGLCLMLLAFTLVGLVYRRKRSVVNRDVNEPLNRDFRGFNVIPNDPHEERKSNLDNLS